MADRPKRSISLPADLDAAMAQAARLQGVSVSGWIAETIGHRLASEAGGEQVDEPANVRAGAGEASASDGAAAKELAAVSSAAADAVR